jgi:hypothetical protein
MALLDSAGPAGVGFATESSLLCVCACLPVITAFLGLMFRSWIAAVLSAVSAAVTTLVFCPWRAFWLDSLENGMDPELRDEFPPLAGWWVIGLVGAITACADACDRWVSRNRQDALVGVRSEPVAFGPWVAWLLVACLLLMAVSLLAMLNR